MNGRKRSSAVMAFGRALPLAVLAVGLLGLLRLGRQFPSAASSPGLLVPFLLPVLALSLEAGALVALSASALGHAHALPSVPFGQRLRGGLPLLAPLALVLGLAGLLPHGTEHPGLLANDLIARARQSCGDPAEFTSASKAGSVTVPLLGLSVRCTSPQQIAGPLPGVKAAEVAMRELTFSEDLRRAQIAGLDLQLTRALRVRIRAQEARISGLPFWTRSVRLSPWLRWGVLFAIGAGLWLAALVCWRAPAPVPAAATASPEQAAPRAPASRWARLARTLLFAVPGVVAAAMVVSLDQEGASALRYTAPGLAAIAALVGLSLLARRSPKLFSSFGTF